MEHEEAIGMFQAVTDAPRHIAEHVLDAHHWDLNNSVAFYLESGGVGHGAGQAGGGWADLPDLIEEPAEEPVPHPAAAAAAVPRSEPIQIPDDDDDDLQILASNLNRRAPPGRTDDDADDVQVVGSLEDEFGVAPASGRRPRRNRPSGAGSLDRNLQVLGRRFGIMDDEEMPVPSRPTRFQTQAQQQRMQDAEDADMPALPDDVNMEEQRMLMAALTGGGYDGVLPDFANDPRFRAGALSPGARERQSLREEQDAAYYESLQADMEREAAAARAKREAEEAERAAREAQEEDLRRQQEEEDRLQRTLSSKQASLPAEPADGGDGVVNLMIRLPSGSRIGRRFHKSDSLQAVFDFVDLQRLEGVKMGAYHLVMQYPRKNFEEGSLFSLADAGLSSKQEALYLEMNG